MTTPTTEEQSDEDNPPAYGLHQPSDLNLIFGRGGSIYLPRLCTPGGIAMPSTVPILNAPASTSPARGRQQRHAQVSAADGSATAIVRAAAHTEGERLLRLRDVLSIVGLSRAHVYNLVKQGLFPRPIALGSNCARWVQSEVQAWVDESIAAARARQARP